MRSRTEHDGKSPLQGVRILVAEDDVFVSTELEATLMEAGAEIVGACRTVQAARALSEADGLCVAFFDLQLGLQSILPVARDLIQRGIPVVLYTGQVDVQALRTECPDCKILAKPAPRRALIKAIAEALHS